VSCSKLKKNIDKSVEVPDSFSWKPVVVSDLKGRYMKLCSRNLFVEKKIKWIYKPGASASDIYGWLQINVDKLISE
jgi:hypothetical protein